MGVWGEMWCCVFLILQTGRWNIGKNKRCSQNKTIHACSFYKNLEETQHCPCTLGKFQIIHFFFFIFRLVTKWLVILYKILLFIILHFSNFSNSSKKHTPPPYLFFCLFLWGLCTDKTAMKKRNMIFDCSLNEKKKFVNKPVMSSVFCLCSLHLSQFLFFFINFLVF